MAMTLTEKRIRVTQLLEKINNSYDEVERGLMTDEMRKLQKEIRDEENKDKQSIKKKPKVSQLTNAPAVADKLVRPEKPRKPSVNLVPEKVRTVVTI